MPPNTLYVSEIANSNVCGWSGEDTNGELAHLPLIITLCAQTQTTRSLFHSMRM